jgi:Rrf2 family transcriptional regulator, cysteine metabolism repressor
MKLSTRARYGTRALLDLAIHNEEAPVPLKDIARRQQISLTYLEHLITPLISAGIIRSVRGARGGISLARPASDITLNEIVQTLEGSTAPVDCIDDPTLCSRSESCSTRDIWVELDTAVNNILESRTLSNLAEQEKKKVQPELMYYI